MDLIRIFVLWHGILRNRSGIIVRMSARAWIGGKVFVEWRPPRRQLGNPGFSYWLEVIRSPSR